MLGGGGVWANVRREGERGIDGFSTRATSMPSMPTVPFPIQSPISPALSSPALSSSLSSPTLAPVQVYSPSAEASARANLLARLSAPVQAYSPRLAAQVQATSPRLAGTVQSTSPRLQAAASGAASFATGAGGMRSSARRAPNGIGVASWGEVVQQDSVPDGYRPAAYRPDGYGSRAEANMAEAARGEAARAETTWDARSFARDLTATLRQQQQQQQQRVERAADDRRRGVPWHGQRPHYASQTSAGAAGRREQRMRSPARSTALRDAARRPSSMAYTRGGRPTERVSRRGISLSLPAVRGLTSASILHPESCSPLGSPRPQRLGSP